MEAAGSVVQRQRFFTTGGLRNWYVNFEHPTCRTNDGFDTFDLTVDLVIDPDLSTLTWKDEDEYAHVRRLGIFTDTEHQAVELARDEALALIADRAGPFAEADRWAGWRWNRVCPMEGTGQAMMSANRRDLRPPLQRARPRGSHRRTTPRPPAECLFSIPAGAESWCGGRSNLIAVLVRPRSL